MNDPIRVRKLIERGEDVSRALHYAIGRGRFVNAAATAPLRVPSPCLAFIGGSFPRGVALASLRLQGRSPPRGSSLPPHRRPHTGAHLLGFGGQAADGRDVD